MKTLKLKEAVAPLEEYARRLNGEPVILIEKGAPVAALIPIDGMDLEALSLSTHPDFLDLIEQARRRHREEGGISTDEMRRQLGILPTSPDEP